LVRLGRHPEFQVFIAILKIQLQKEENKLLVGMGKLCEGEKDSKYLEHENLNPELLGFHAAH